MKPTCFCTLIVVSAAFGFVSPPISGQGYTPDQIYGRDIANSLRPGPPRRGKEKMEQVDAQKLPSKTVTDTKFQGSLLDAGLGSTGDTKSHEEKARSDSDKERPSKSADTGGDKEKVSKSTDSGGDKEKVSKSTDAGGDGHNKDQKATSARPDEKASGSSTEKASASKADGTR